MITLESQLATLGITDQHRADCKLQFHPEARHLATAEHDIFDRPVQMTPDTCRAWVAMKQAAASDGIVLQLVSGYRSVDYQCEVIQNKLQRRLRFLSAAGAAPAEIRDESSTRSLRRMQPTRHRRLVRVGDEA